MPKTEFIQVSVTPRARDVLRAATLKVSAEAGQRLSMSDALEVLTAVALRHPDELGPAAGALLEAKSGSADD